jgi:hypothetical protein
VNSAVSLWTELEVLDDDEDQYTYMTLDTREQQLQLQQRDIMRRQLRHPNSMMGSSRPAINSVFLADDDAASSSEDPILRRQEEAYWRSFRSAVQSFSDQRAAAIASSSDHATLSMSYENEEDEHTDVLSFRHHFNSSVRFTTGSCKDVEISDDEEEAVDDDLPPCLPRTVVTPTASIGSTSGGGGSGSGGSRSMSVASLSSSSSHPHHRPQEVMTVTRHSASTTQRSNRTGNRLGSSSSPAVSLSHPPGGVGGGGDAEEGGKFAAIRRSLKELTMQAAINKRNELQQPLPGSPEAAVRRKQQKRGDPDFAISASLAGPSLEEIKGWRWRMKELAEHAAVVAKGDQGAERLVIGVTYCASSSSPPASPSPHF